jgi:hypothetical protein
MKSHSGIVQAAYNNGFDWPWKPDFEAVAAEDEIVLSWTNPSHAGFEGTLIRYSTLRYPETPTEGDPVPNGDEGRFEGQPGSQGSFIFSGLSGGTTYYFAAYAYDHALNHTLLGMTEAAPTGAGAGLETPGAGTHLRVSAEPNPGRGSVSVRFGAGSAAAIEGAAEIRIFNTAGQTVRNVTLKAQTPRGREAASQWLWDGRSDSGIEVPPGIYFVSVRSGQQTASTKAILVR